MKALSLHQHDIAKTITDRYESISKLDAIKYIKSIFGDLASLKDICVAYDSITFDH